MPPPEAQAVASRTTTLTPMAMNMFLSGKPAAKADPVAPSSSSDDVQGLTQMYYLVEEEEAAAATATATAAAVSSRAPASEASAAAGIGRTAAPLSLGKKREWQQAGAALPTPQPAAFSSSSEEVVAGDSSSSASSSEGSVTSMYAEPQGLTQLFYLDPEEEAEAAAALPVVPRRSFLRERLGVPGEVVQDLRQVRRRKGFKAVWGRVGRSCSSCEGCVCFVPCGGRANRGHFCTSEEVLWNSAPPEQSLVLTSLAVLRVKASVVKSFLSSVHLFASRSGLMDYFHSREGLQQ